MLNESIPTASASTASSTVLRMTTSPVSSRPDSSTLMGTNESNPNSMSWGLLISVSSRLTEAAFFEWASYYLQLQIPPSADLLHMQAPTKQDLARIQLRFDQKGPNGAVDGLHSTTCAHMAGPNARRFSERGLC